MRKLLPLLLLALFTAAAPPPSDEAIKKGSVVVVPLDGEVSQAQFYFLRRILKQAEGAEAAAFVIDMNTPGGRLDATEEIVQALVKSSIPTYTYINTNAGSAGALISLGTKNIYMAPVSAIGAAAPVMGTGQEVPETMNAKMVSYFSGYFRSVAELNGYNPNLVDAFMNTKKEVKIGDTVINPEGSVLTLSPQEAIKEYDGKPLLAKGIVSSVDELCEKAGLNAQDVVRIEPSGFERIALLITTLAPLFLLGGMIGAYMEFKSPGFGVAGVLSALCFLLFFAGHYVAGLTGFEVIAVFVLGVVLVLLELIFFPGVVVLALFGTALMIGSLLFAMVDFYPSQPLDFSWEMLVTPLVNMGIAIILFVFVASLIARFLPSLPFFNRLVLAAQSPSGTSTVAPATTASLFPTRVMVGEEGVTRTILRPAGKVEFGSSLVDVVTDGEFLDPGTRVRVVEVEGDRVVVGSVS